MIDDDLEDNLTFLSNTLAQIDFLTLEQPLGINDLNESANKTYFMSFNKKGPSLISVASLLN